MALPLDWMADVLRTAGVEVVEYPGWRTRAAPGAFSPRAVVWHHDASAAGPSPGVPRLIAEQGNTSTPPPLAHAWVDTAGRWHLTAAGRAHHAGTGSGWGRIPAGAGNAYAIGVETDHTVGEAWPPAQLEGLRRGTAALLRRLGADPADALCGHREYAPGRKIDPAGLDMNAERRAVAALMRGEDMPSLREIEDAAYRAVLNALNDARHGRNPTAVEARDSLGIMALEQRQHQSRYSTPDGRRSDYTATPVDYLLNVDAHVYQLLVDALPAAVREIKEAVAAPQVDLDALADKVAERIADQVAVRVADILGERLALAAATLRPGAEVRA